jgi:hypothetical protein
MISAVYKYKKTAAVVDAFCPLLRTTTHWTSATAVVRHPLSRSGRCSTFLSLSAGGKNETAPSSLSSSFVEDMIPLQVIAQDLVGLLIAFQLLGLVDAVNAPDFLPNGGWLQPPPPSMDTSTFPSLAGRFALNAIVWISAVMTSTAAPTTAMTPLKNRRCDEEKDNGDITIFGSALGLLLGWFCLLRVLAALVIPDLMQQDAVAFEMILQDCYFVGLGIVTTRFLVERSRRC